MSDLMIILIALAAVVYGILLLLLPVYVYQIRNSLMSIDRKLSDTAQSPPPATTARRQTRRQSPADPAPFNWSDSERTGVH